MMGEEISLFIFQALKNIEENLKEFDEERKKVSYKDTSPKETKDNVNLITLGKRSPFSTSPAKVLAYLQGSLELLTYGVPYMNQEMHEEEKEDTGTGMLEERRPSFLPMVGGIIDPGGGILVFCQEVPTYQLIQDMHEISAHIF